MGKIRLGVLVLFGIAAFSSSAFADDGYCSRTRADFMRLAQESSTRLAYRNSGGLIGGGVCWWHSRLQRNAIYLTRFAPNGPKPTASQASQLVSDLIGEKRVVTIPGYSDFNDFSADHWDMIQSKLESWQKTDGFFKFGWIRGLRGDTEHDPKELSQFMDDLFHKITVKQKIIFTKLQLPGITAHAWLVVGMERVSDGYYLSVIDSNDPSFTRTHYYRRGDTQVVGGGIYEGFQKTVPNLWKRFKQVCGHEPL